MERKETPIISSFWGLVKKGNCPICDAPISAGFGSPSFKLCPNCGDYLEVSEKKLLQVDTTLVMQQPTFAAPTPWTDMQAPRFPTISFPSASVEDYLKDKLTEMAMTKKEGVRIFDAKWPIACCVCGKPPTREEATGQQFTFTPPGLIRVRDHEATVLVKGVPHCADHKEGGRFGPAAFATAGYVTVVGLLFRSYAYQIQFRKLNPWKWC